MKYTEEERNAAFGYLLALHIRRTLERIRPELSWNRNDAEHEETLLQIKKIHREGKG